MKLNGGAKRHHYSMFNVGRSMFDVHLIKSLYGVNMACECLQNKLAIMGLNPEPPNPEPRTSEPRTLNPLFYMALQAQATSPVVRHQHGFLV